MVLDTCSLQFGSSMSYHLSLSVWLKMFCWLLMGIYSWRNKKRKKKWKNAVKTAEPPNQREILWRHHNNNKSEPEIFADLHDDREREPQPLETRDLSQLRRGVQLHNPDASGCSLQCLEASKSVLKTAKNLLQWIHKVGIKNWPNFWSPLPKSVRGVSICSP